MPVLKSGMPIRTGITKVNGEAPGKELRLRSYFPKEIQEIFEDLDNATVYEILKKTILRQLP